MPRGKKKEIAPNEKTEKKVKSTAPSKTKMVVETIGRVARKGRQNGEEWSDKKEEKIAVTPFEDHPANVKITYKYTVNMGNFESATVECGLSMPCYVEEIDKTWTFAENWVTRRMEAELSKLRGVDPEVQHEEVEKAGPVVEKTKRPPEMVVDDDGQELDQIVDEIFDDLDTSKPDVLEEHDVNDEEGLGF